MHTCTLAHLLLAFLLLTLPACGSPVTLPTSTPRPPTATIALATVTPRATATPAPATPVPTDTPTPTPTPIIHVIQRGDTLLGLAYQYGVSVQAIQEANGVVDPRRLRIGQKLLIPRPTPEEGPPPTPTPTPMPYALEGVAFYETPVGSLLCLGEVHNLSDADLEHVQVAVQLLDERGQVLSEERAFTALEVVPQGGRAPFAVLFPRPPTSYARYQVYPLSGEPVVYWGSRYPHLSVVEHQAEFQTDLLRVQGKVRNDGEDDAEAVEVVVTAYEAQGRVVGLREVALEQEILPAGEAVTFTLEVITLGQAVRYQAQVQGRRHTR